MKEFTEFLLSVKDARMIDFKKVFSWNYLTDNALSLSSSLVALLGYIFVITIVAGIIISIVLNRKNKKKPLYSRLRWHIWNMTLWLGLVGTLLAVSRFFGIFILNSRLLLLANIIAIIVWTAWIGYYWLFKMPKIKQEYIKKVEIEKYLPKPKKVRL